jgi:hypothetical protein
MTDTSRVKDLFDLPEGLRREPRERVSSRPETRVWHRQVGLGGEDLETRHPPAYASRG